jgi:hypothetical protein
VYHATAPSACDQGCVTRLSAQMPEKRTGSPISFTRRAFSSVRVPGRQAKSRSETCDLTNHGGMMGLGQCRCAPLQAP